MATVSMFNYFPPRHLPQPFVLTTSRLTLGSRLPRWWLWWARHHLLHVSWLATTFTVKMEASGSLWTTWRYNPENRIPHNPFRFFLTIRNKALRPCKSEIIPVLEHHTSWNVRKNGAELHAPASELDRQKFSDSRCTRFIQHDRNFFQWLGNLPYPHLGHDQTLEISGLLFRYMSTEMELIVDIKSFYFISFILVHFHFTLYCSCNTQYIFLQSLNATISYHLFCHFHTTCFD
jgi:hypothetical protein